MKHLFTYTEHLNEQAKLVTKLLPKIEPWMIKNLRPAMDAIKRGAEDAAGYLGKLSGRVLSRSQWEEIWLKFRKINDRFDLPPSKTEKAFNLGNHNFYLDETTGSLITKGKLSGFRNNPTEAKEVIQKQVVDKIKKAIHESEVQLNVYFETNGDDYSVIINNL